ncbi:MAG: Response regulator receiver protein [Candidatus Levybacteria bacterium GW2011_GWA1_37_16]|nr:MAG: Response regulator receiver protein [Candidatus Levybacteria bacterium GW2011_GWA1_37_16]
MKVLIIDDDENLSAVFETALQKAGLETVFALNGKSGIDKARSEQPNLILLDQVLPDISGNEVLKTLKMDSHTQRIPVLILSNFSQEELVKEAINNGAMDYIFKYQVEPQDLVNKVKQALKMQ